MGWEKSKGYKRRDRLTRGKEISENIKKWNRINVDYAREKAKDEGLETGGECLEDLCEAKALVGDYFCFECGRD